jgi:hypothetical protein
VGEAMIKTSLPPPLPPPPPLAGMFFEPPTHTSELDFGIVGGYATWFARETAHSTQHTAHSAQRTAHSTQYTAHSAQRTAQIKSKSK